MDIVRDKKLKNLLDHWPPGYVATSTWLNDLFISEQLRQRYLKSEWIESMGYGAYKRPKDNVKWFGALAAFQNGSKNKIHVGGSTALAMQGITHYIRMGKESIFLFSKPNQKLPVWFKNYEWGYPIEYIKTTFLPENLGIKEQEYNGFLINTSTKERAILECLYLIPNKFDVVECYQLIETMNTMRPNLVQELLENCNSIQVKRLFLFMAKKAGLPISEFLDTNKFDLGSGVRSIVKSEGKYEPEFNLIIPKELVHYV